MDTFGVRYPTLVVEIGYVEGREVLLREAEEWLSPATTVQLVVLIRVSKKEEDGSRQLWVRVLIVA